MHPTCLLYLYVFIFTIACAFARRRSRFQREPLLCGDWARLCPIAILLLLARTDHTARSSFTLSYGITVITVHRSHLVSGPSLLDHCSGNSCPTTVPSSLSLFMSAQAAAAEQVLSIRKAPSGHGQQYEVKWRGQSET